MPFTVLEPGLCTTVQDRPRTGRRGLGVSTGGPADAFSLAITNLLLGNPADAAALEMTMPGPTLQFDEPTACAVFGAPFEMTLAGKPIAAGGSFSIRAGDVLRVRGCAVGIRTYLALPGGIRAPTVLGCASSETPLRAGETFEWSGKWGIAERAVAARRPVAEFAWNRAPRVLRALPGDHLDLFDARQLCDTVWRIGSECDRMGLRLNGPSLERKAVELLSEPICPGTVQITNEGKPVVLGGACQTIGGYPRALHVIAADIDKLGQLRPGDQVRFELVNREEAERVFQEKAAELAVWRRRLGA